MSVVQIEDVAAELEQHRPAILAYLYRVLGQDAEEREDIAQEVCLRAYRAIARGQAVQLQTFRPWLYRIAKHVAIDHWRHRTCLTLVPLDEMEQPQQSPLEERVIERTEITLVLAQLTPVFAECLLFYHGYGYSVREIAQRQQVESHLVRVRLMRARRQFAAIYRRRARSGEAQPARS
jgi:RNA polymerase sigma-70 factor (ECF subfamily)